MKLHRKLAEAFGYDLIKKKNSDLTLATHISRLLDVYKPDIVLDVGANEGQFGKKLRSAGFSGQIISFEPIPSVYKKLEASFAGDSKWSGHNFALGDENTSMEISVPENSTDFGSILDLNDFAKERFQEKLQTIRKETIQVKTLDQLIQDQKLILPSSKNVFLKLDTQGYDLKVLKGSKQFLKNVTIILSELSCIPIYEGMPSFIETYSFLDEMGFTPTGFFPISRNKSTLAAIEMDGVFVRKS